MEQVVLLNEHKLSNKTLKLYYVMITLQFKDITIDVIYNTAGVSLKYDATKENCEEVGIIKTRVDETKTGWENKSRYDWFFCDLYMNILSSIFEKKMKLESFSFHGFVNNLHESVSYRPRLELNRDTWMIEQHVMLVMFEKFLESLKVSRADLDKLCYINQ
jgi:hypothetical protein